MRKKNFLDKDDFDIDLKDISEPLITFSKIINVEEIFIILPNKSKWGWTSIFEKLVNDYCDNKWFCFSLYLLEDGLNLIFGCLMYWT